MTVEMIVEDKELTGLFQQIESEGWTVTKDGEHEYMLSKFSPAG